MISTASSYPWIPIGAEVLRLILHRSVSKSEEFRHGTAGRQDRRRHRRQYRNRPGHRGAAGVRGCPCVHHRPAQGRARQGRRIDRWLRHRGPGRHSAAGRPGPAVRSGP
ncbi:hypothetical protein SGPA1_40059 [Streptomyces misionensis JCM 4497]